jgi:hypothetical protein
MGGCPYSSMFNDGSQVLVFWNFPYPGRANCSIEVGKKRKGDKGMMRRQKIEE